MRRSYGLCVVSIVLLALLITACGGGKQSADQLIKRRFPAKKDGSGVVGATLDDKGRLSVDLRFSPVMADTAKAAEREMCVLVGGAVKQLFESSDTLNEVFVRVSLPYKDAYGNVNWKQHCEFSVSFNTYAKIRWDTFDRGDLLSVADDVKRF